MGFPDAEAHHQEHERLMLRLEQIVAEFNKASGGENIKPLIAHTSQLLNDWLVAHIISCDLKMKPFLKGRLRS
jgi:hemerythrin